MPLQPVPPGLAPQDVEKLRWETFGHKRATSLRSVEDLVQFTQRRGFVLLLPQPGMHYPSVLEATVGRPLLEFTWDERAAGIERWTQVGIGRRQLLSTAGLAGRATLVVPAYLPDFYALSGNHGDGHDHELLEAAGTLGRDAATLCRVLAQGGPLSEPDLQDGAQLAGRARAGRFAGAILEAVRRLLVVEVGAGAPGRSAPRARAAAPPRGTNGESAPAAARTYDLLTRVFPAEIAKARLVAPEAARQRLACRYLRNVLVEDSQEMARVLEWNPQDTQAALHALVERHMASVHPASRPQRHLFQATATDLLPPPAGEPGTEP